MNVDPQRDRAPLLRGLLSKYERIRRLRVAAMDDRARRAEMRSLAAHFPGALRETDELPMWQIEERIDQIEALLGACGEPPPWMRAMWLYHGCMRAFLAVRLAAGRDKDPARARRALDDRSSAGPGEPSTEALRSLIPRILRPPGRRLHNLALEIVSERLGVTAEAADALLFVPLAGRGCPGASGS